MGAFEIAQEDVIGHNDVSAKTCPNFNVSAFVEAL
jgi:hypothetical protein